MMQQHSALTLKSLTYALILLLLIIILLISLLASVPPVSRDALTHHLAVPKLYLRNGGIYEIPDLLFTYYPMNLDLLYLIPLHFQNDIAPKFIHFGFALITAFLVYKYLFRRLNQVYALLGCSFFLSIPIIIRLSSIAYVDLGLVCFLFGSLLCLFYWIESGFKLKFLVISAILCGLALGTKYNGLVGLFLLALFVPFVYSRYRSQTDSYHLKAVSYFFIYIFIALVIFSPWMIRNIVWTSNPVYPLYRGLFSSEAVSADGIEEVIPSDWSPLDVRSKIYGESTLEILLIPIRVFLQGADNRPELFDGKLNPFLLILPIFAFLGFSPSMRQVKTEKMMMLFFSILFLLIACLERVIRIRYFAPILPPLVILSMFGLYNIKNYFADAKRHFTLIGKSLFPMLIFFAFCFNFLYLYNRFNYVEPIKYLTGELNRDEYIQKFRPEYATIKHANRILTNKDKILGVYLGNRGYYSNIDIEFSITILRDLASKAESAEDIAQNLHKKNFTCLLVNYSLFNHWVQTYSFYEKKMLKIFFERYTEEEYASDGYGLLRLVKEKSISPASFVSKKGHYV